jgi:hypothetical protein
MRLPNAGANAIMKLHACPTFSLGNIDTIVCIQVSSWLFCPIAFFHWQIYLLATLTLTCFSAFALRLCDIAWKNY